MSYEEQIMSKDKFPSKFSRQMEAIVFIILQIFYATRAVLKIGEYSRIFPCFSWGIFARVKRLDQSRASENILYWHGQCLKPLNGRCKHNKYFFPNRYFTFLCNETIVNLY